MRSAVLLVLAGCSSAPPVMSAPDAGMTMSPDAGSVEDSAMPPMDSAPPPQDCTRKGQAKTAPVALFDQFLKTKDVDALMSDVQKNGGTPLEDPNSDRVVF